MKRIMKNDEEWRNLQGTREFYLPLDTFDFKVTKLYNILQTRAKNKFSKDIFLNFLEKIYSKILLYIL